jgi:hypothetical protein
MSCLVSYLTPPAPLSRCRNREPDTCQLGSRAGAWTPHSVTTNGSPPGAVGQLVSQVTVYMCDYTPESRRSSDQVHLSVSTGPPRRPLTNPPFSLIRRFD